MILIKRRKKRERLREEGREEWRERIKWEERRKFLLALISCASNFETEFSVFLLPREH